METTLPDDLVLEILLRLTDDASLFRCAATCKLWRCLVADDFSSFLRRRWPDNSRRRHPSCLLGFFANNWHVPREILGLPVQSAAAQTFVPGPRSALGGLGRRSLSALVPIADSLVDRVTPLASHGGLLLVRFVPLSLSSSSYSTFIHLAVCNLFVGTCEVLPPLLYKSHKDNVYLHGFAILTAGADGFCSNGQQRRLPLPDFKVLIVGASQDAVHYHLYMFSSDQPSWSAPRTCLDRLQHNRNICSVIQNNAVVRGGTAHWLCWDFSSLYSFDVNAETGHVSLAKLPVPFAQRFLFHPYCAPQLTIGADGNLMLVRLHIEDLSLDIWTRQENGADSSWLRRTRVIQIERPKNKPIDGAECVCFGDKSGILLLVDNNRNAYLVDVETGAVVEEMTDRFTGLQCKNAIPVDVDWPAFFLSRLRGH